MFSFLLALAMLDAVIVFTVFFITTVGLAYLWRKIFPKKKKDELVEVMKEDF